MVGRGVKAAPFLIGEPGDLRPGQRPASCQNAGGAEKGWSSQGKQVPVGKLGAGFRCAQNGKFFKAA
jgi:hypothetical protein